VPRLRQAVLAARDIEPAVESLRQRFDLGQPYRDPEVAHFGLVNAVFAIGDTFLEVVSPVDPDQPGARTAARQLERSGSSACGYMAMVQVDDLRAARARVQTGLVREVFEVDLADIAEVHLHPADMHAIVALSEPRPPNSWRWGGYKWHERSVAGYVAGITVAVRDPDGVATRWAAVAGGSVAGCRFVAHEQDMGIVGIELDLGGTRHVLEPAAL
jgi:Glyoxalase-like domain